jgi:phosphoglycolate phosphatase-like HAD superfamily hydrolase
MALELARISALIFDVDGTLRDTDDQMVLMLEKWLRIGRFFFLGKEPRSVARWLVMKTETPGNFVFGLPDRLGIDERLAHLGNMVRQTGLRRSSSTFLIIPGVREMLAKLKPHYPMSIVSARDKRATMAFLEQFELTSFFQHIATAHTCRYTKPHPDPILWVAKQMRVPIENCLMVGDTSVDIRAGKAAGAQTVGVLCGFGELHELERMGADLILTDTPALADVLLKENKDD